MGKKNFNAFVKRQKAEKKRKKKEEKRVKLEEREQGGGKLTDMIAFVDEFGNIVDEPPEEILEVKEIKEIQEKIEAEQDKEERFD
ncbi:cold-shock protein [Reichenbachiella agarivorans]|uniref:Cold-shock protein n=1 Tax=Reichenbachiella agarivorans TaxID=2979464 RepID=A0ABY6CMU0_9BACT|nr:cold-shock protein [Reichenbachiella agarivorans]UXP31699.1 cold-shock protein [Reichenbachiella agarivorans]